VTPVGHIATSGIIGAVVLKLTGSAPLAAATAVLAHVPLDLLFNEYYGWDSADKATALRQKITMVLALLPAIAMLIYGSFQYQWMFVFGFLGAMPDIIDEVAMLLGFDPIVPSHCGAKPIYWLPWLPMMTLWMTVVVETIFAAAYLVAALCGLSG
jgi:hypothetical protein